MFRWVSRHCQLGMLPFMAVAACITLFFTLRPFFTGQRPTPLNAFLLAMIPLTLWLLLWILSNLRVSAQAIQSLNRDCDPEPLLDYTDSILRQARWKSWRRMVVQARIDQAVALLSLGRFSEALESLDPSLTEKGFPAVILWFNRSSAFCLLNQVDDMVLCLDRAEDLAAHDPSINPRQRELLTPLLSQGHLAHRLLADGPSPEIETAYKDLLARSQHELHRVNRHFNLALCAISRNDIATAREHLNYVIAHGNKLHVRTKAQELLSTLPAQTA